MTIKMFKPILFLVWVASVAVGASMADVIVQDGFDDGRRLHREKDTLPVWYILQRPGKDHIDPGTLEAVAEANGIGHVLSRTLPERSGQWHFSTIAGGFRSVQLNDSVSQITLRFRVQITRGQEVADSFRFGLFNSGNNPLKADHHGNLTDSWAGYWVALGFGSREGISIRKELGGRGGITQDSDVTVLALAGPTPIALKASTWYSVSLNIQKTPDRLILRAWVEDAAADRVALAQAVDMETPLLVRFDQIVIGDKVSKGIPAIWSIDDVKIETVLSSTAP